VELIPIARFRELALVADDASLSLIEAAASIAQDEYPEVDTQTVLAEVDAMADKLKRRIPADAVPVQRLRWLNRYFFQELGFAGNVNNYYDPRNSYLHTVLSTRRGIPITLAVLYIELATQIGDSFRTYGRHVRHRHTVIFGGVGQGPQVDALRRGV
jgi:regulator of sirC expression with transglutaminase-like and TPR domain